MGAGRRQGLLLWLAVLIHIPPLHAAGTTDPAAEEAILAHRGQAQMNLVVATNASSDVQDIARTLANYLGRISGGDFRLMHGDGREGIAIGVASDFPDGIFDGRFPVNSPADEERYRLRSHAAGLQVIGATDLAVRHAVWDLLYRLGHRQFFPGETWEVVPEEPNLRIALDVTERPDYIGRRIWYGYGMWGYNVDPLDAWRERNRSDGAMVPRTGHSYRDIYRRNREIFDAHPEYVALRDGKRVYAGEIKFCLSNPEVREIIVTDRLTKLEETGGQSVSVDPSDGGGWCECRECEVMGSISDRVITLANDVAEAAVTRFGNAVYVGTYAYGEHSPPPNIAVHSNVIVSIATSYIRGGYTMDELIAGWQARNATLGIREYYSIYMWDRDLPGRARGARPAYLAETIPHFHAHGARFLNAESADNWGPNGLGYYLAARMLWDVGAAGRIDALIEDFVTRAFGAARGPMKEFYELINGPTRPMMSDHLIGRMYRLLEEAYALTDDARVIARLDHLTLYTHYVELQHRFSSAGGDRQAIFERIIRHSYRMRETMMVHSRAIYRRLWRMVNMEIPEGADWATPEAENPWKDSTPFSRRELETILTDGIANHDLIEFDPVAFSDDLVPATPLKLADGIPDGEGSARGRGSRIYYTWMDEAPADLILGMTGGLISHYRDRGDVEIAFHPRDEAFGNSVSGGTTAPDGKRREITLHSEYEGLHRILFTDGGDMTEMTWPAGTFMTFELSTDRTTSHIGRHTIYFYVPRGAGVVGAHVSGGRGTMHDGDGKQVFDFGQVRTGFFHVPVPEGGDGRLWRVQRFAGSLRLMTVPPYGAFRPADLLLPREVVDTDTR